jgi:hypothetical protein
MSAKSKLTPIPPPVVTLCPVDGRYQGYYNNLERHIQLAHCRHKCPYLPNKSDYNQTYLLPYPPTGGYHDRPRRSHPCDSDLPSQGT